MFFVLFFVIVILGLVGTLFWVMSSFQFVNRG